MRGKSCAPAAALIIAAALFLGALSGCSPGNAEADMGDGLFCWDEAVIYEPDGLLEVMDELELTSLFQHIPRDAEKDDVRAFLKRCGEHGIGVYLLTGDPAWGLDPAGDALLDEIDRAEGYNSGLGDGEMLLGIMADVETYLTDEWDADRKGVMESWADAAEAAHRRARSGGLAFLVCIPYYLDDGDSAPGLERLLGDGCDGAALMNYNRSKEAEHIEGEIALLGGKPVTVVYELQSPGSHGLTDKNTYHDLGLDAVRESAAALRREFGGGLNIALHHYGALKELMSSE